MYHLAGGGRGDVILSRQLCVALEVVVFIYFFFFIPETDSGPRLARRKCQGGFNFSAEICVKVTMPPVTNETTVTLLLPQTSHRTCCRF